MKFATLVFNVLTAAVAAEALQSKSSKTGGKSSKNLVSKSEKSKSLKPSKSSKLSKAAKLFKAESNKDSCTNEFCVGDAPDRCGARGGKCYVSSIAFLTGDGCGAANSFFYGRYCGVYNRCSMFETTTNPCTSDNRPEPCDSIDAACMVHDRCYDGEDITCDDRTECDIKFISALNTVLVAALQGDIEPTGLCDDEFYTANLGSLIGSSETITGIDIVMHESILVAAPYCCGSIKSGCTGTGGSGEPGECDGATNICGIFERALGC